MHAKAALLLGACFALLQAYQIPSDSPDGLYLFGNDGNGNETMTYQGILSEKRSSSSSVKFRARQLPSDAQIGCQQRAVNPADLAAAQNVLDAACNGGAVVSGGNSFSIKHGDSVAYVCSYGGENPCSSSELDTAYRTIGARCGFPAQGGECVLSLLEKSVH